MSLLDPKVLICYFNADKFIYSNWFFKKTLNETGRWYFFTQPIIIHQYLQRFFLSFQAGLNLSYCYDIYYSLYKPFEVTRGRLRRYLFLTFIWAILNLIPIIIYQED